MGAIIHFCVFKRKKERWFGQTHSVYLEEGFLACVYFSSGDPGNKTWGWGWA